MSTRLMERTQKKEGMGKKLGKLGVLGFVIIIAVCTGTIGTQTMLGLLSNTLNMTFSEYIIYGVSGSLGILFAAVIGLFFMKKSKWWVIPIPSGEFSVKKMCLYAISIAFICKILYEFLFTLCFANTIGDISFFDSTLEIGEKNISLTEKYIELFFAIMIAPITEELLFRKCLYSACRTAFGVKAAIVLNTLIFAASHGYGMQGLFSCILAGALFTCIFEKTGHIWYTIAAHILCNGMAFLSERLERIYLLGKPLCYEVNGCNTYHIGVVFAAVFVVICCGYLIKRDMQKEIQENRNVSNISS